MLIDMLNWEHLLLIVSQVHLIIVVKKECWFTKTKRHKTKSYFIEVGKKSNKVKENIWRRHCLDFWEIDKQNKTSIYFFVYKITLGSCISSQIHRSSPIYFLLSWKNN
jgi:hypothetical protein